jgi:hypothetical protein
MQPMNSQEPAVELPTQPRNSPARRIRTVLPISFGGNLIKSDTSDTNKERPSSPMPTALLCLIILARKESTSAHPGP